MQSQNDGSLDENVQGFHTQIANADDGQAQNE